MTQSRNIIKEFASVLLEGIPVVTVENSFPVVFSNTTTSNSIDTGALTVNGGVGIGGNLVVGKSISVLDGLDMGGTRIRNLAEPVLPNDAMTLSFFSANAGGVQAGMGIDKQMNVISVNPSQPQLTTVGTIKNGSWNATVISTAYGGTGSTGFPHGEILFGTESNPIGSHSSFHYNSATRSLHLAGLNDTTGSGTGTLVVSGGGSFSKGLHVGSVLTCNGMQVNKKIVNITDATEAGQGLDGMGALTVAGGCVIGKNVAINGNIYCGGSVSTTVLSVTGTTDATSPTNASLVVAGGFGVRKSIHVGTNALIAGSLTVLSLAESTSATTGSIVANGGASVKGTLRTGGSLHVAGEGTFSGKVTAVSGFSIQGNISYSGMLVSTPVSGGTVVIPANVPGVILELTGPLEELFLSFPTSVLNGHVISISTTDTITTVGTLNVTFARNMEFPVTFPAGSSLRYMFLSSSTKWYRI
jgi:hypothetical protein